MLENIIYIIILILIPIVPAYVIFKNLKNAGHVIANGPFAGLKWDLGGAFGGYILVLLVLYPIVYRSITPPSGDVWRTWKIEGQVQINGSDPDVRRVQLLLRPPVPDVNPVDGQFRIDLPFPIKPDGNHALPCLIVQRDGLLPISVPLPINEDEKVSDRWWTSVWDVIVSRHRPSSESEGPYGRPLYSATKIGENRIRIDKPIILTANPQFR